MLVERGRQIFRDLVVHPLAEYAQDGLHGGITLGMTTLVSEANRQMPHLLVDVGREVFVSQENVDEFIVKLDVLPQAGRRGDGVDVWVVRIGQCCAPHLLDEFDVQFHVQTSV